LNRIGFTPEAGISLIDFVEKVYFPMREKRLEGTTIKGYRDSWNCHIKSRVTGFRVRDFRTVDGENLMQDIEREHGNGLAHGTYKHIKVTLSAIFTNAKRIGVFDGANPMQGVSVPKGKKHGRKRQAYSLEEIEHHLDLFSGPVRLIIGVAACAGLRLGEIRRLWWEDDDGEVLNICRSVWRTKVKETKTGEDDDDPGVVPIIGPLRVMLDSIRPENAYGFMFPNTIGGSLDLDNIAERVIKPRLKEHGLTWKGWHAYRRGLATNLHQLGIPDKVIQAILRHEDVRTTQRSYIKTASRDVSNAMKQLEAKVQSAAAVQQLPRSNLVNRPEEPPGVRGHLPLSAVE